MHSSTEGVKGTMEDMNVLSYIVGKGKGRSVVVIVVVVEEREKM